MTCGDLLTDRFLKRGVIKRTSLTTLYASIHCVMIHCVMTLCMIMLCMMLLCAMVLCATPELGRAQPTRGGSQQPDTKTFPLKNDRTSSTLQRSPIPDQPSERVKAKRQGYIDEREAPRPRTLSHTLIATIPGAAFHGLGHWNAGDHESALKLFLSQSIGLIALFAYFLIPTPQGEGLFREKGYLYLKHIGVALFMGSWFADIFATYQGVLGREIDQGRTDRSHFTFGYRYNADDLFSLTHHLVGRFGIQGDRLYLKGRGDVEIQGDLIGSELDLGVYLLGGERVPYVGRPAPFRLSLGAKGRRWAWEALDISQLSFTAYLQGSLSLGKISNSLKDMRFYHRIGGGFEGYQFDTVQESRGLLSAVKYIRPLITFESGMSFNLFQTASLSVAYLHDETQDLTPIRPEGSILALRVIKQQSKQFDLMTETLISSDMWTFWLSIRVLIDKADPINQR